MKYEGYLANLSTYELVVEYNAYNPAKKLKTWKRKRSLLEERILELGKTKKLVETEKPKQKAAPNGTTIGGLACSLLCKTYKDSDGKPIGLSYGQILEDMKNIAPDSNVSIASLRWYASKIKKGHFSSYLLPERRVRKKRAYEVKEVN